MTKKWGNITILVVEDDLDMREVLCDFFKDGGATVFDAENGKVALEVMSKEQVDLVVSDVQMPIMDGVELLKMIRAKNPEIPIVLFTTGQSQLTEESAIASGASGLLNKPYNFNILAEKISELLLINRKAS